jgi:L-alanine-DL-glutamate epimerase-like enolase superfamily enzyme
MKIRRVSVLLFSRTLDGTAWNPAFRWTERRAPLLVIEDVNGQRGIGEAWSAYRDVESPLKVLCNEVAPALVGRTLDEPSQLYFDEFDGNGHGWAVAAAWSAADMALWDLFGKERRLPVWRMLGGTSGIARVYASGGLYRDHYSVVDLYAEACSYRRRGFRAMKMKVAGLSVAQDLERVAAARRGIGADAELWIDAVNRLSVESARSFWQELAPYGVRAIQSPLPADQVDEMAQLNLEGIPVIASEAEFRHKQFRQLLDAQAVSYLQFCPTLCGGITGAAKLDDEAYSRGVGTTPQCFSTAVAQAATLHFAAGRRNVVTAEFHCFHDHLSLLYQVPGLDNGQAIISDAAGLGVSIPELGVQADGSVITCISQSDEG